MHSYLAYANTIMALVHPCGKKAAFRTCSQHYAQAVTLLRSITVNFDQSYYQLMSMLHTVHYLAIAEFRRGRYMASKIQRQALKRILHLIGGLDPLDWACKEIIIHYCISTSALLPAWYGLKIQSFDTGPLGPDQVFEGHATSAARTADLERPFFGAAPLIRAFKDVYTFSGARTS